MISSSHKNYAVLDKIWNNLVLYFVGGRSSKGGGRKKQQDFDEPARKKKKYAHKNIKEM